MGRQKGYRHTAEAKALISERAIQRHRARPPASAEYHRQQIKTGMLIRRLHAVGSGQVEATAVSVQACIALLRKTLPDLATVEHTSKDGATTRIIITGVVRAEDITNDPKLIEHETLPSCYPNTKPEQKDE